MTYLVQLDSDQPVKHFLLFLKRKKILKIGLTYHPNYNTNFIVYNSGTRTASIVRTYCKLFWRKKIITIFFKKKTINY